ncbi:protein MAIN-LIKE 1-like [Medicago truncatula]|uniref:protein MAIN-LIKE 1-like n=1 Tax=Medicago truncatula TaxID=3880 RepID=UPI000D2F2B43|nr:protein MAIN-LIKE 1-like [Medicago truncatula]
MEQEQPDVELQHMEEQELEEELHAMDEEMKDGEPRRRRKKKEKVVDPEPLDDYPGGPHETGLLWKYHVHVARKAADGVWRGKLKCISNRKKIEVMHDEENKSIMAGRWWENRLHATDLGWLQDTSYIMIDHDLIYAFVGRWHEETSSFQLPFGEMKVTLDDVASLLHIPIDGMLLSHGSISRDEAVEWMELYLGSSTGDALKEVEKTKGAHCRFVYLEEIFKDRLKEKSDLAAEYGVTEEVESDKSQWAVDVVYLKYFRDLDLVAGYSWGVVALAHLYKELNNTTRWNCSQVAGYLTSLQAWVFHHFPSTVDNYRNYLDALDLTRVVMTQYGVHRHTRQFERVGLYSGWLRCGERMVRYLPKRVFRQFGWFQTIPRHPIESAPVDVNLAEITNRFRRALDYALTPQMLGETAIHGVEAVDGYIEWFYQVSHPHMILPDMPVPVPRPPEREVLDARAAQEDGDLGYLQLSGKMSRIRDHIYVVMRSGLVPKGTEE